MTQMNHVGVTVGDLDAAVEWYGSVLGLELMDGPMHCSLETVGADRRREVFGEQWGAMRLAHMITSNGTGLELFQFLEPPVVREDDNFTYWRVGPHHVAFTVDDFHGTLAKLVEGGGRQRTADYDVHGGAFIVYCEDPWGNTVELVSVSYRTLSHATTVD